MNVVATPKSRKEIRNVARKLRKIVGAENIYEFPIIRFIEYILEDPENGVEVEILEVNEMQNAYGMTFTEKNKIYIRRDVYDRAAKGNPRDKFTLCHEVGHYLMHQPNSIAFARGDVPKYCDPEWQANTFAGELMAPYDLVKDMSAEEIMRYCGMSRQAAIIQYKAYQN